MQPAAAPPRCPKVGYPSTIPASCPTHSPTHQPRIPPPYLPQVESLAADIAAGTAEGTPQSRPVFSMGGMLGGKSSKSPSMVRGSCRAVAGQLRAGSSTLTWVCRAGCGVQSADGR